MKPIEKYQQKFIKLLKEAEEELGGALTVTVRDRIVYKMPDYNSISSVPCVQKGEFKHEYSCSIGTEEMNVLY